jgi:hypothetical protein
LQSCIEKCTADVTMNNVLRDEKYDARWVMILEMQEIKIGLLKTNVAKILGRKEQRNLYLRCLWAKSLFGDDILKTRLRADAPPPLRPMRCYCGTQYVGEIGGDCTARNYRVQGLVS